MVEFILGIIMGIMIIITTVALIVHIKLKQLKSNPFEGLSKRRK